MLESQASLADRVALWSKTVQPSLLWGLQTTRAQDKSCNLGKIKHTQRLMFRKMLKLKRRVVQQESAPSIWEPWLEWHIRSFRKAGETIRDFDNCILDKLDDLKRSWAGHVARLGLPKGTQPGEQRLLKAIVFWRPLAWWRDQQWFNKLNWSPIKHPAKVGRPKRW